MEEAKGRNDKGSSIARLIYPALDNRIKYIRGQVFLSIPAHCVHQIDVVKSRFKSELNLDVLTYATADASRMVSKEALNMIKNADYFFGDWHHEQGKQNEMSPWLPFELGAAMSMCKEFHIIAHRSLPKALTERIEKNYSLIRYDDNSFGDAVTQIIAKCRSRWGLGASSRSRGSVSRRAGHTEFRNPAWSNGSTTSRSACASRAMAVTVSRTDIIRFASEFDPQPFHVDEEAAKGTHPQWPRGVGLAHRGDRDAARD